MSKHNSENLCKYIQRVRKRNAANEVVTHLSCVIRRTHSERIYVGVAPDTDEGLEELINKRDDKLYELQGY